MIKIFALLAVFALASGCATPSHLEWKLAKGTPEEKASRELAACERDSIGIRNDKFGSKQYAYIVKCMEAQGHRLIEVEN